MGGAAWVGGCGWVFGVAAAAACVLVVAVVWGGGVVSRRDVFSVVKAPRNMQ